MMFETFYKAFDQLDKETSVQIAFEALNNEKITIIELYEGILRRSLAHLTDKESDPTHKIWKEHIQSSIVRTILEMAYPFVLKQRSSKVLGSAAVLCPDQEQHELGARMVADYLTLLGYKTYFVGRNTPRSEFVDLIKEMNMDVIAMSVTNYYNVSTAIKTIQLIQQSGVSPKILVGGIAVAHNPKAFEGMDVTITQSVEDLKQAVGGGK